MNGLRDNDQEMGRNPFFDPQTLMTSDGLFDRCAVFFDLDHDERVMIATEHFN